MKKIILSSILLCLSLFGEEVEWKKYNDFMLNNKENKPAIYFLSASYCSYCKKTINLIDNDKNLNNYINENFIPIYEEEDTESVPNYLKNNTTPTIYVLDNKGNKIGQPLIGAHNKEVILKFLNQNLYKFNNGVK